MYIILFMSKVSRTMAFWLLPLTTASLVFAQVKLPDGEGKEQVQTICTDCHGLETTVDTNRTEAEWQEVVDSMVSRGAMGTDDDFKKIVKYLAKNFGKAAPAPKTPPEKSSASSMPAAAGKNAAVKFDARTDWLTYGGDESGRRYSPLAQIDAHNVARLKLAWQYGIDNRAASLPGNRRVIPPTEAVPIVIGGVMFTPTMQHTVVALEADTGREIWKYDLGKAGAPLRGVSFWPGDTQSPAEIFAGASDGRLIALNAETGKPVPGFGNEGVVNLRDGVTEKYPKMPYRMSSPGVIYKNLIITGSARTGRQFRWAVPVCAGLGCP